MRKLFLLFMILSCVSCLKDEEQGGAKQIGYKEYKLFERDNILKDVDCDLVSEELMPIRLWDIDYHSENDSYSFVGLSGKKIEITKRQKKLWEMADGNNSISDILSYNNSLFPQEEYTLKEIIEFYVELYNSFALVFSKY